MTNSLGAWKKAPLAYVLAEVRTEFISNINDYLSKLGGQFREEYPIQRKMHAAKLVATENQILIEPGQDSAWEFATIDNKIWGDSSTKWNHTPCDIIYRLDRFPGTISKGH